MTANDRPIFQTILGADFEKLPASVRYLHGPWKKRIYKGKAKITRGKGVIARIVCFIVGFPVENENASVNVSIFSHDGVERWIRDFDGKQFHSILRLGTGSNQGYVIEQFGLVAVAMEFVLKEEKLYFITRRWFFLGMPLPHFLRPGGNTFEHEVDGKFNFDVKVKAPLVGHIVSYKGWLLPIVK